jgi:hypothetical protein
MRAWKPSAVTVSASVSRSADTSPTSAVEPVGGRHEFGDGVVGRQQHPLVARGLQHHVGERAERRLVPRADHNAQSRRAARARDVSCEEQPH